MSYDPDELMAEGRKRRKKKASMGVDGNQPHERLDKRARGGHITAAERHALPKSDFALSGERYPVDTEARARNALARGAQHATPDEQEKIKRKVHSKYPDIKIGGE